MARASLVGVAVVVGIGVAAEATAVSFSAIVIFAGAFGLAAGITVFSLSPPRFANLWRAVGFEALTFPLLLLPALLGLPFLFAGGVGAIFRAATVGTSIIGLLLGISMLAVFVGLLYPARDASTRTQAPTDSTPPR